MLFSISMGSRKVEKLSEIDRILQEELSESEVDDSDADPDFQLSSDHDSQSDIELEEKDVLYYSHPCTMTVKLTLLLKKRRSPAS